MRYSAKYLLDFGTAVMQKAGLPQKEAELFMDSLITSDLRGIGSHGISRLKTYAARLECGVVNANAQPVIAEDSPGAILVDGCNMMGAPLAVAVMDLCIERAKANGSCFAADLSAAVLSAPLCGADRALTVVSIASHPVRFGDKVT